MEAAAPVESGDPARRGGGQIQKSMTNQERKTKSELAKMIGRKIYEQWYEKSATGRNQLWCSLDCGDCGTRIKLVQQVIMRTGTGKAWLVCEACKRKRKAAETVARKRQAILASGRTPRIYKTRGSNPPQAAVESPFGLNGLRALAKLKAHPARKKRALEILARSVRAQVKAGIDPKPQLDQMLAEAAQIAMMEEKGVPLPGDWTAETRAEGLKTQSYDLSGYAPAI